MINSRKKRKQLSTIQYVYSFNKVTAKIEAVWHYTRNNEIK